jgi:hypothetical protein
MREAQWIKWTRTRLQPREREDLLTALTSQQKAWLLEHDYVWVEGVGVLWNPPDGGPLRRARFTHGTHFQTQRGEFYIDSEGSARELSDHRIDPPMPSARPPSLPGTWREPTTSGAAAVSTTRSPDSVPSSSGEVGGAQNDSSRPRQAAVAAGESKS